jgi:hypothetical protein
MVKVKGVARVSVTQIPAKSRCFPFDFHVFCAILYQETRKQLETAP